MSLVSLLLPSPAVHSGNRAVAFGGAIRHYLQLPLLLPLLLVASILLLHGGDQWIADQLYRWQGHHWAAQEWWWTNELLHQGGRDASRCVGGLVCLLWLAACCFPRWRRWRKPLLYLFLAAGLSTGLVSLLKHLTQMDCPWDLSRYGGTHPFIGLFQSRPASLGTAACFPSGHASAGFAWIALYFFALITRPDWRYPALAAALLAGFAFGLAQQLRGAHFLSHDLMTLAISWTVAATLFAWMFGKELNT